MSKTKTEQHAKFYDGLWWDSLETYLEYRDAWERWAREYRRKNSV